MTDRGFPNTAVMIGAGNIGRGFVGAAFAASGYETVFIDVDGALVNEINRRRGYPVRILLPDGSYTETIVRGVRAVNGNDGNAAAAEIARAAVCATAVGVRAMPHIAPVLAFGLAKRAKGRVPPLNIIVCENMIDAGQALRSHVLGALPPELAPGIDAMAGFPEAVIGRMVPIQTPVMKEGDLLRVCVEKYGFLPVDRAAFKGAIPQVEGMVPLDRFGFYVKRKLFIHNLGHAAIAYLGLLGGYTYIADAAEDADILYLAVSAMRESAAALSCEYEGEAANLGRNIDSLIYRFSNRNLGDTCVRVAADPARKLGRNDRLIGALENCARYGLPSVHIAAVTAAAAIALEKVWSGNPEARSLASVTGLSPDSAILKPVMMLGTAYAAASVRSNADAAQALRRAAIILSGDITIL